MKNTGDIGQRLSEIKEEILEAADNEDLEEILELAREKKTLKWVLEDKQEAKI